MKILNKEKIIRILEKRVFKGLYGGVIPNYKIESIATQITKELREEYKEEVKKMIKEMKDKSFAIGANSVKILEKIHYTGRHEALCELLKKLENL